MKPVYQTREGYPNGNCLQACIASVLEVSLDDVPEIPPESADWVADLHTILAPYGYYTVDITTDGTIPQGWHLIAGKSPRGDFYHSVVGLDGEMVHDPHLSGDGLRTTEAFTLFVTFNPAEGPKNA